MRTQIVFKTVVFALAVLLLSACGKETTMNDIGHKSSPDGKSGSMARMVIKGDYIYAVDVNSLKVINISNPQNPVYIRTSPVGRDIETIYPFKDYLFIGSNSGMYIYSLSNPENPVELSQFTHATACDPVIADDYYAFITLRSTEICNRWEDTRQIDVLNVTDPLNPGFITSYITTYPPYGLDMNSTHLFVCHGKDGFIIYSKAKVIANQPGAVSKHVTGVNAFDAILYSNILFIIGESGFYQYDIASVTNPVLLSSILAGN
jgi:hypothetical protein